VPKTIGARGANVGADVSVDGTLGVTSVVFKLGTRTVCTDTKAPYDCKILPTGADVGDQSIMAIVTDTAGQTATDTASVTVARFKARLKAKVERKPGRPTVRKIRGSLVLPPRVTKAQACAGTVAIAVSQKKGRTLLPSTEVPVRRNCTFALRIKVPDGPRHKFVVDLRFGGNEVLLPAGSKRRFK
jgi:hypothetical protein